jgi:hypothetical protein
MRNLRWDKSFARPARVHGCFVAEHGIVEGGIAAGPESAEERIDGREPSFFFRVLARIDIDAINSEPRNSFRVGCWRQEFRVQQMASTGICEVYLWPLQRSHWEGTIARDLANRKNLDSTWIPPPNRQLLFDLESNSIVSISLVVLLG